MHNSKIQWTNHTWNPVRGCSRVSEGCRNCYAEAIARRFQKPGMPYHGLIARTGQFNGNVTLHPEKLLDPWRMVKPRKIFVNSTSDLFHENVPFSFIAAVFSIMAHTTRHTYQVLTKRPERMKKFMQWLMHDVETTLGRGFDRIAEKTPQIKNIKWEPATKTRGGYDNCGPAFPFRNIWLGVSVEDQKTADERIPHLLETPAVVRWISAEPLLGPIQLRGTYPFAKAPWSGINWIVIGGESGHNARPFHIEWAQNLVHQFEGAGQIGTPHFFIKQLGANPVYPKPLGNTDKCTNSKTDDINKFPPDLQVREFPTAMEQ